MSPADLPRLALQVLLPSFPGTVVGDDALRLLEQGLGGLCLFGSNTADGPATVRAYAARAREVSPEAVLAIDEEGGDVTRLHATTGSPFLGAGALGAADDLALTRLTATAIGAELAGLGLDLALGPVADVNSNPDNPVIGVRSFGTEPDRVGEHVAAWVAGLQSAGPAACAKHVPGHGDTRQDSHLELPEVDASRDVLERRELVPFRAAVTAGVEAVMTSHLVVRALDPERLPATFSAPVLSLLRARPDDGGLGFAGLVVSDALDMAGASAGQGIPRAAVRALAAGADLLCLGPDKDADLVRATQREIVAAVGSGELDAERLAGSAARVRRLAQRPRRSAPSPADVGVRQLAGARAALRVEGVLPDLREAVVLSVETEPNIAVGTVPWGLPAAVRMSPDDGPPPGSAPLLVQVREAHRRPDVLQLLERLAAGRTVVLLEWGWPGELAGALARLPRLVPFGSARPSVEAVAEALRASGWRAAS
jgi:beta-N-acetylhexosaminidase